MTRLPPLWSQSGSYPATTDRRLVGAIWPQGGVTGMTPTVVASTMQIQIAAGNAVVPDTGLGAWLCSSDAPENVAITTAPPSGQNRIDLVVVAVDDTNAAWSFQVVTGTPSASPTAPNVPAGTVPICQILVTGGSAVLSAGNLTDRRGRMPTWDWTPQWTPVTVNSPWTATNPVGYMKTPFGFVHLRGTVQGGTSGTTLFTLPAGYRPGGPAYMPCTGPSPVAVTLLVTAAGAVIMTFSGTIGQVSLISPPILAEQ